MSAAKKIAIAEQMPLPTVQRVENPLLSMLGNLATNANFNAEAFRMIVDLIREEKAGQAKSDFNAAFAAMQAIMEPAEKRGTGHNNKKFARYEDIDRVAKPAMNKNGLSINHTIHQDDSKVKIRAVLRHIGGHEESAEIILPLDTSGSKNPVQAYGSTTSYGKRYTYAALVGIAAEETDDDGKAAGDRKADASPLISEQECADLRALLKQANLDEQIIFESFSVEALSELTKAQHAEITAKVNKKLKKS
jgi:hypothetical protein